MRERLKATKLVIVTHEARMLLVQAEDLWAKNTFLGKKKIFGGFLVQPRLWIHTLSSQFLSFPYKPHTLIPSSHIEIYMYSLTIFA